MTTNCGRQFRERGRGRGLTLLELLVTIVLLAMVAAVATGFLAGTATASERMRAVASVKRADSLARSLARIEGASVRVSAAEEGTALVVSTSVVTAQPIETRLPQGVTVSIVSDRNGHRSIDVDATGRSVDFVYLLSLPAGQMTIDVAGRTGQLTERSELPR